MSSFASLSIDLLLESSSFMAGLKRASEQTAESSAEIKEYMEGATEAVKGLMEAFAVDYIAEKVESALEYAEAIKKVSEATGASTTFIQQFNYAASQGGVSTDTATAALEKFTISLGKGGNQNQKVLKTFKDLGVTSSDTTTALLQFANGLEKVPTEAQKAADVVEVFGKGAINLLPVLESLAGDGFANLAAKANDLGVVLNGSVIEGAVEGAHKMSELKQVINAEFANVIDQNANSIVSMAEAMIKLTSAIAGFMSAHPQAALAIMGAMAGGVAGGLPGAAIGGVAGYLGGGVVAQNMSDGNGDLTYREQQVAAARTAYHTALNSQGDAAGDAYSAERGGGPVTDRAGALHQAAQEYVRQIGLLSAATARAREALHPAKSASAGTLPGLKGTPAPKDHSADQAAAFDKALMSAEDGLYSLKEQLTTDPGQKAMYQHYQNFDDNTNKVAAINDNYAAGKDGAIGSDIAKARRDQLLSIQAQAKEDKDALINRQEDAALDAQDLALRTSDITNQEDLLKSQQTLATNSTDRLNIALQLLDLDYQLQKAQLDAVIASKQSSDADIAIAKAKEAMLPQLKANAVTAAKQQNAGPLGSYINAMPKSVGDLDDSLQSAAVDGFGKLNDGLVAAINGTGSLKSAFKDMAQSMVTDLEKVVLEETIIKPLANLLTGGSSGGGLLGSLASSIGGAIFGPSLSSAGLGLADISAPASMAVSSPDFTSSLANFSGHANGGMADSGTFMVGERGPELMSVGAPSNVIPFNQLSRGNGGSGLTVTANVSGVNDPAMVKRLASQVMASAAPALVNASTQNTMASQKKRRMR